MFEVKAVKLDQEFFQQDALTLAPELLGKKLIRTSSGENLICRIVEVEAYVGPEDKGCHAYQNKRTDRTEVMFWPGGHAYIYLIYGIHNLLNVVASVKGKPEAVLLRACEPLQGIKKMAENRELDLKLDRVIASQKTAHKKSLPPGGCPADLKELTDGPGKLTQALAIDRNLNGHDLRKQGTLYLADGQPGPGEEVVSSERINIDYAEEYREKPWRFYLKNNDFVSC